MAARNPNHYHRHTAPERPDEPVQDGALFRVIAREAGGTHAKVDVHLKNPSCKVDAGTPGCNCPVVKTVDVATWNANCGKPMPNGKSSHAIMYI